MSELKPTLSKTHTPDRRIYADGYAQEESCSYVDSYDEMEICIWKEASDALENGYSHMDGYVRKVS